MSSNDASNEKLFNVLFFGHTVIYIYIGYTLLDFDGMCLLDSGGNNLMCK